MEQTEEERLEGLRKSHTNIALQQAGRCIKKLETVWDFVKSSDIDEELKKSILERISSAIENADGAQEYLKLLLK